MPPCWSWDCVSFSSKEVHTEESFEAHVAVNDLDATTNKVALSSAACLTGKTILLLLLELL